MLRGIAQLFPSGADADFHEARQAGLLGIVELRQRLVDISTLLAKFLAFLVDALHHQLQLADLARRFLVDVDDFTDFGYGEADPASAKDFLQQSSVGRAVKTRTATTFRMDQAFVFIESKCPGRDAEFTRQFCYTVILLHNRTASLGKQYNIDFYVQVNFAVSARHEPPCGKAQE